MAQTYASNNPLNPFNDSSATMGSQTTPPQYQAVDGQYLSPNGHRRRPSASNELPQSTQELRQRLEAAGIPEEQIQAVLSSSQNQPPRTPDFTKPDYLDTPSRPVSQCSSRSISLDTEDPPADAPNYPFNLHPYQEIHLKFSDKDTKHDLLLPPGASTTSPLYTVSYHKAGSLTHQPHIRVYRHASRDPADLSLQVGTCRIHHYTSSKLDLSFHNEQRGASYDPAKVSGWPTKRAVADRFVWVWANPAASGGKKPARIDGKLVLADKPDEFVARIRMRTLKEGYVAVPVGALAQMGSEAEQLLFLDEIVTMAVSVMHQRRMQAWGEMRSQDSKWDYVSQDSFGRALMGY